MRQHGLLLSLRAPTARVIESLVVDYAYGLGQWEPEPPPTALQKELARAVDTGLKLGSTRAQIFLPDQKLLLDEFKKQLQRIIDRRHPWMLREVEVSGNSGKAMKTLIAQIDEFQKLSVIDKMVNVFKDGVRA